MSCCGSLSWLRQGSWLRATKTKGICWGCQGTGGISQAEGAGKGGKHQEMGTGNPFHTWTVWVRHQPSLLFTCPLFWLPRSPIPLASPQQTKAWGTKERFCPSRILQWEAGPGINPSLMWQRLGERKLMEGIRVPLGRGTNSQWSIGRRHTLV